MRQIFLDTETTGLEYRQGHRLIEIAGVEMVNRRLTKQHFHRYINPERDIDQGALNVHGISREFLADKPLFAEVAKEFLDFVRGAELIIHNASFDVGFLNNELSLLGLAPIDSVAASIRDTLRMARELFPGKKNNLNALCDRFQIDNTKRVLHGALLDAELLAEVYLAMTRGQGSLIVEETPAEALPSTPVSLSLPSCDRPMRRLCATAEEIAAHEAILAGINKKSGGQCLWLKEGAPS